MPAYVLTLEDLKSFKTELMSEVDQVIAKATKDLNQLSKRQVVKNSDEKRILQVSDATLCNLRNNGVLPFAKIGGTIYYEKSDVEDLFEKNGLGSARNS